MRCNTDLKQDTRSGQKSNRQSQSDPTSPVSVNKPINLNQSLDENLSKGAQDELYTEDLKQSNAYQYSNVKLSNNHHLIQNKVWINNTLTDNTAFPARIEIMNNQKIRQSKQQKFAALERSDLPGGRNMLDLNEQVRNSIYDQGITQSPQNIGLTLNNQFQNRQKLQVKRPLTSQKEQVPQKKPKEQNQPYTLQGKKAKFNLIKQRQMNTQLDFLGRMEKKTQEQKLIGEIVIQTPVKLRKSQVMRVSSDLNGYDHVFREQVSIQLCDKQEKVSRRPSLLADAQGRDAPYQSMYHQTEFQKQCAQQHNQTRSRKMKSSTFLGNTEKQLPLAPQTYQIDQLLDMKLDLISQKNPVLRSFDFKRKKKERFSQIDQLLMKEKQNQQRAKQLKKK